MILPVRNATLLKIAGGGSSEDWDQPAGGDATKWEGRADAHHVQETLDEVTAGPDRSGATAGAALDEIVRTRLIFSRELAPVQPGDSLTYQHDGASHTRKVLTVAKPDVLGVVQATLEPA